MTEEYSSLSYGRIRAKFLNKETPSTVLNEQTDKGERNGE